MLTRLNRWKHFTAMALIGDGLMAVVRPQRDAHAWAVGPRPWRAAMRKLDEHPNLTRVLGGVQVAAVMYWLLSQEHED
jgi:class 3 adenylate cyclase